MRARGREQQEAHQMLTPKAIELAIIRPLGNSTVVLATITTDGLRKP